jgi:hypothetical protein
MYSCSTCRSWLQSIFDLTRCDAPLAGWIEGKHHNAPHRERVECGHAHAPAQLRVTDVQERESIFGVHRVVGQKAQILEQNRSAGGAIAATDVRHNCGAR